MNDFTHVARAHRPMILGRRGGVASNHPLATQAGIEVLRGGGNAADAAVAIALTLGVAEPQMSGLGGDGFYHHHDATQRAGTVHAGCGLPPAAMQPEHFRAEGMPLAGPRSVSVPGSLGALHAMHARHGSRPWKELCASAIAAAREGFGVTHTFHRFSHNYRAKLAGDATSAALFLRAGEAPAIGSFIAQPRLAETLEQLADSGAESFYRGALARRIVQDCEAAGVPIGAADLADSRPEELQPLAILYRGFQVHQTPPPSMGFTLLQELRILEHFDLAGMGFLSPEAVHVMVEAKKLAFLDRERHAGDPRSRPLPLERLLSADYAASLAKRIRMDEAAHLPLEGAHRSAGNDTTYFCVLDAQGDAVSGIQSLNNAFGAGVTLPGTGIVLNNRMTCWHLDPAHPNALQPGKRVRHTMNAPMVLRDGRVWALFGTPGADDQVQVNLQMATGLIDFGRDPQSLAEAPRWSSDQQGQEANWPHGGRDALTLESSMPAGTLAGLRARGHHVVEVPPLEGPCSVAVLRTLAGGGCAAGSDPRRDGWAAAY